MGQIELGEKTKMSPNGLCPTRSKVDRVISTFSFDPNLEPSPQIVHRGEANGPPESVSGMTQASTGRRVNDEPGFHSDIPVSELAERDT